MRFVTSSILIALTMTLATTPAMAQGKGRKRDTEQAANPGANAKQKKADNEAYERALKSIPDAKPVTDPWQGAR